jgi:thioredoxin 1
MALEFTDQNFEKEVLKSDEVALVDFWAPWCGPCQRMAPVIDELADEMKGQPVKVGKMNVDENQATPGNYGIMSIPTLIVFKKGQPVEQIVGLQPKEALVNKLKAHLG